MKRTFIILILLILQLAVKAGCDTIPDSYDNCLLEVNYEMMGTVTEYGGLSKIPTDSIWKYEFIDAFLAVPVYGDKARYGLIAIITKSNAKKLFSQNPDKKDIAADLSINPAKDAASDDGYEKIFYKVEVEAEFPGGEAAWVKYIQKELEKKLPELSECPECVGVCTINFIVEIDGRIRSVEAETMEGTILAEIIIKAIKRGPKWKPAYKNGRPVAAYRRQNITFNATN